MVVRTTEYLAVLDTGLKTVVATKTTSHSGLHVLQIMTLNDFSASASVANQLYVVPSWPENLSSLRLSHAFWCNTFDVSSETTIKPNSVSLICLNSSRLCIFVTNMIQDDDILMGFFRTRTNMEVNATLALFFETFAFLKMPTYSTFTMCLHENDYSNVEYN